jgi:flagellar protein FliL
VATKPDAGDAPAPPKSKKLIIIGVAVVVLLAVLGGGYVYIVKQRAAADEDEPVATKKAVPHGPPTYLPMDNMVVNLADPGGEKVAQVGITLELTDAKATEMVKPYMPAIRSGVLLLISQRTAEELLSKEGKEKLAQDVLAEAARPFGGLEEPEEESSGKDAAKAKKKKAKSKAAHGEVPVKSVLFSSFIVQ